MGVYGTPLVPQARSPAPLRTRRAAISRSFRTHALVQPLLGAL